MNHQRINIKNLLISKILLLIAILSLGSCSKQEGLNATSVPTPPCSSIASQTYSFQIKNNIYGHFFECDTTFPNVIRLSANPVYTNVKWSLTNSNTVYLGDEVDITYANAIGRTTITMIGRRPLNTNCFPHDDGVDTLSKPLDIIPLDPMYPNSAIEGKFLGATIQAPTDTFTIHIFYGPDPHFPYRNIVRLVNLNKGCPGTDIDISAAYQGLTFNQTTNDAQCHGISGTGYLEPANHNKIHIDYDEVTSTGGTVSKTFLGIRTH